MLKKSCLILILFALLLPVASFGLEANWYLVPPCVYTKNVQCNFCDMMNMVIRIVNIILGSISALSLLMFVYGGFVWITSTGNEERITKGRKILSAAIIGIIIIAFAWVGINTIIRVLTGGLVTSSGEVAILGQSWAHPNISCTITRVNTCQDAKVGAGCYPCVDKGGATGDTNCYCHIPGADGRDKEIKNGGCKSDCTCMSLCDKLARDTASLSSYICTPTYGGTIPVGGNCRPGDLCPHMYGKDPTHQCCKK